MRCPNPKPKPWSPFSFQEGLSNLEHLLVGSAAGLLACSATYPLDTMRTQMSITGGLKGSLFSVGAQIVKNGGPGALYKGFTATLASDVLGSGLGFMNYEVRRRTAAATPC